MYTYNSILVVVSNQPDKFAAPKSTGVDSIKSFQSHGGYNTCISEYKRHYVDPNSTTVNRT